MPSYKAGQIEYCLLRKLKADQDPRAHKQFKIHDDAGREVASTGLSRSWRASTSLSPDMVSTIKRELGLSRQRDFDDLIRCPLSRDEYLDRVSGE